MEFLLIVVAVVIVGTLVLAVRHRTPRSMESSISEFERRRDALRPGDDVDEQPRA